MPVTITGTVFHDLDHDGRLTPGDPGIAGVNVVLYPGCTETTTDTGGLYRFLVPAAGTYTIYETAEPSGSCPPSSVGQPAGYYHSNGPRKTQVIVTEEDVSSNASVSGPDFSHDTLDSPIPCDSEMILFEGRPSRWLFVNLATGASAEQPPLFPESDISAIGYNTYDSYVYGYDQTTNTLVRVGRNGEVVHLYPRPAGMPAAEYTVGTLDFNGFYYVYAPGTSRFYTVDLRPGSPTFLKLVDPASGYEEQTSNYGTPLSSPLTIGDWAFNPADGFLYGVERNGTVYRIDERSGAVTPLETSGPNPGNTFGSVVIDGSGNLYAVSNSDGTIYRYLISGNTATGTRFSSTPIDDFNDAALCPYASIELDYGDAPDAGGGNGAGNYNTLLASNGPRHALVSNLFLGVTATAETDAYQNATATGDDLIQGIQDDALPVPLPLLSLNAADYTLSVQVTNNTPDAANLYGWIDFNQNGLFEEAEAAPVAVIPAYSGTAQYPLTFIRPGGSLLRPDHTFLRLRLTTDNLTNTGLEVQDTRSVGPAFDGEVEDYIVRVGTTTDLAVTKTADLEVLHTGDTITYKITVTNYGPEEAFSVVLEDIIPPEITDPRYSIEGSPFDYWPGSIALGNMAPGQTITVTIQGVFDGTSLGPIVNTATVTSYSDDPDPGNNSSTVITPAESAADLSITKTAEPETAVIGDELIFTITVTNSGPDSADNVIITDLTEADFTNPEYSIDGGASWFPWTGQYSVGTLGVNGSFPLLLRGTVEAGTSDSLINTASVTSDTADPNPDDNEVTILVPKEASADLGVVKFAEPEPAAAGQELTFTIVVTNSGPSPADDVQITDLLPAQLLNPEYSTDRQNWYPWTGTYPAGTLEAGMIVTLYLRGIVDPNAPAGTISNTVTVSSPTPDPDPDNNSFTVDVTLTESADLSVTKTSDPYPAVAGDSLTYTLTVVNGGPSVASDVLITDPLPAGFLNAEYTDDGITYIPWTGQYSVPTLAAGDTLTITIRGDVSATQTDSLVNTVLVTSSTSDPDTDNNSYTLITPVTESADLSLVKSGPSTVTAGETITYTLEITNHGPSAATGAEVSDTLPAAVLNAVYSIDGVRQGPWFGTALLVSLAPNETRTIEISGTVSPSASGSLRNSAFVSSSTPDPDLTNNLSSIETDIEASADLSVVKTASPNPASAGQLLTYTVIIANAGPSDAESVSLSDSLPTELTNPEYSPDGQTWSPWTTPYSVGTVTPGSAVVLYVRGAVSPSSGTSIVNTASVSSATPDPNPDNNEYTVITPVGLLADLSVVKTSAPDPVTPGGLLTYTVTVSNAGPADAQNAVLTDSVSPLLSSVTYSTDGGVSWNPWTGTLTLGNIAAGGSSAVLIRGTVSTDASGTISNTASVSSATPDPDPDNNETTILTPVNTSADLSVTKSASPTPAVTGQLLTYTVTVRNAGPDTAQSVIATDPLPPELTGTEYSADGGVSWNPWSSPFSIRNLAAGEETTILIRGTLSSSATGVLTNTVSVSSSTPDPDPDNNTFTLITPISISADLSITKTAEPDPAVPGSLLTYTVTVTNAGPNIAEDVILTDTLDTRLQNPQYSLNGGAYAPWTGSLAIGQVAGGQSAVVRIRAFVAPDASGQLVNTAAVSTSTPDPEPDNNTVTIETPLEASANLAVTKTSSPVPAVPGETLTYTLTVTNAGPSTARDVTLVDAVPDGIENPVFYTDRDPAPSAWTGTYTIPELAPGVSVTVTIQGRLSPSATGRLVNTAVVTGTTPDPDLSDNMDTDDQPIIPSADISIVKTASPNPAVPGQIVTYTLTVANAGPSDAQNVIVTDSLPAPLTNPEYSLDGGASWNPWTGTYQIPALTAGNGGIILIRALLPAGTLPGGLTNTATVASTTPDPDPDNNSSTNITPIASFADLELQKTAAPAPASEGGLITYSITVNNLGPNAAENVVITDTAISFELIDTEYSTDGGTTWSPWNGSYSVGTIPDGGSFTALQIRGMVPQGAAVVINAASVSSTTIDPNPDNNTDSVSVPVVTTADLSVTKTASPSPAVPGRTLTYTVTVTNNGPGTAQNVVLIDAVPSLLTGVEFSADGGLTWLPWSSPYRAGSLNPGDSAVIRIRGTLRSSASGSITNSAVVTSSAPDPDPDNNTATAVTPIQDSADLSVTKLAHPNPARPGQYLTYTVLIANAGPAAANDVVLTDLIRNAEYSTDGGVTWLPWTGSYQAGTIAAGILRRILIRTLLPSGQTDSIPNTASVTSSTPDPEPDNNTVTVVTPIADTADLVLQKTSDTVSAEPGDIVTYRIGIRNLGTADAENVRLRDDLTSGLTDAEYSLDGGASWSPWTGSYVFGLVRRQEERTLLIRAVVSADSGSLTNRSYVSSDTPDPDHSNNTDSVTVSVSGTGEADLSVKKTADPNPVLPGRELTYTIRVYNAGPSAAKDVQIFDNPGALFLRPQYSADNGATWAPWTNPLLPGSLAAGAATVILLRGIVAADACGRIENSAVAVSRTPDPNPGNNSGFVSVPVGETAEPADLGIVKTACFRTVYPCCPAEYSITVTNYGPGTASGVTVSDPLPAALTDGMYSTDGGCTWQPWTGRLIVGELTAGSCFTFFLSGTVDRCAFGTIENCAEVTGSSYDPNPVNNRASACVCVCGC